MLVEQITIEKLEHQEKVIPAKEPTCTSTGLTEGKYCAKCNNCKKTFEDYTNISLYKSNYGYTFFKTATNGKAMTKLYDEMEERLADFHKNYNRTASYFEEYKKLGSFGAHGWNIVKMDDGNWYWFDPTWGENNKNKYFCVPDDSFKNHTPWPSNNAQITLPKASNTAFSSEDILEINEIFRMGNISYKLISSKTVIPLSKRENGPNKIAYNGVVYDILEE